MTFLDIFSKKPSKKSLSPLITIDNREKNSLVPSELSKLGLKLEFKQLPVADYIVGNTAIERKTISDFKSSIINKRIFSQLLELKQFPTNFLILEGINSEDIYSGTIHENAFRGFLLAIINEYKVPIIFTQNEKDTAKYLSVLARKKTKSSSALRASKILLTEKEQLQFILEGFPNIGPSTAEKLLKYFKNLKNIFNASQEELSSILGKKAENFYNLLNTKYK
jgi:ERCC4-type nuclease